MFLGDSINAAVTEFWQLAMTLASLKYIAGLVRQEVDASSASTGHEEDNKQSTESHRPSHVDKKEAHSNKGFAKNEEIEPAALISSVVSHSLPFQDTSTEPEETQFNTSMVAHYQSNTEENCVEHEDDVLSMVCHQTKIHFHMDEPLVPTAAAWTRDHIEDEELEQTFLPSMVTHQLAAIAAPAELSELPVSMSAHVIVTVGEEDGGNMIESSQKISMLVHQITTEDILVEQDVTVSLNNVITAVIGKYEMESEQELEVYDESGIVTNSFEEKLVEEKLIEELCVSNQMDDEEISLQIETGFIPSMCTHQLSILETPIENPEYLVSMAVHRCNTCTVEYKEIGFESGFESDPGLICSMVFHQVSMEDKSLDNIFADKSTENYLELSKPIDHASMDIKQLPFPSSMVAHQLSFEETPADYSEFLVSTASHGYLSFKQEDEDSMMESSFEMDPGMLGSMVSHQLFIADKSIANYCTDVLTENNIKLSEPSEHEIINVNQLPFSSSIVSHQLQYLETPVEFSEFLFSTASYECLSIKDESNMEDSCYETDPGMLCSMVSHQVVIGEKKIENMLTEDLTENTLGSSETIDYETMNIHQLPLPSSMVSHHLPIVETPTEFSEFLVSHGCLPNTHYGDDYTLDSGLQTSMVAHHQIIEADNVNHNLKTITLKENLEEFHTNIPEIHSKTLKDIQEDSDEDSHSAPISLVTHQLAAHHIPTQCSEYLISSVPHGCISTQSDYFVESGLMDSMVAHQTTDIRSINDEDEAQNTGVIHQSYTSYGEETEHMPRCLNTEDVKNGYTTLKKDEIHKLQEDPESEMDSKIRGNDSTPGEETHLTSLISHQLPFLSTCDQSEYTDCSTSMVHHLDMSTAYQDEENIQVENNKCLVSMVTHTAPNESCKDDNVDDKNSLDKTTAKTISDVTSMHENQIVLNINAMEAEANISELVENNDNSYTDASQLNENTKEAPQSIETDSNNCQDKRPVGIEEDEKISESCDNSVDAAKHTYNDSIAEAYSSKLTRIQELQRLVEDEIGEFENKRKNNNIMIENNVQTTETLIVNNVKDVEFKSSITIHHHFNSESDAENNEEIFSDDESISSGTESINSVIFTSSDVITNNDEQNNHKDEFSFPMTSELNISVENLIQATCTIGDNKPVIITTNQIQTEGLDFKDESEEGEMEQESEQIIESDDSQKEENYQYELGQNLELDDKQEKNKNSEDFNDLKMHLRKMPQKSSNIETKIREKELLSSLFKKSQKKSQEKQQKSSMTIATLNENVKKETFKIRFKVRLNAESSKSSVLKYLFGCFGGEKIFHQTQ
eukprot:GFUD01008663.1.p1 GENE.GFUD01008663.1~~GFUD01008663.1.p1  ORF type:complete len:1310 (-),score=349.75 GFUD01008663.1:144-4073(-)